MANTQFGDGTEVTSSTMAGTEIIPARLAGGGDAYTTPADLAIYSGKLSPSVASVTTANVTGVVRTRHLLDISGMTADRNFVLPAGAVGDEIQVVLTVGDATYELILIGDTGITINGGAAATEWSRLFITGENVRFVATSTSNWQVINDGRLSANTRIENTGAQSIANNSITVVVLDEVGYDVGDCADTTNYRIYARRAGKYMASAGVRLDAVTAAGTAFVNTIQDNAGARIATDERDIQNGRYPAASFAAPIDLTAGQYVELTCYQNTGGAQNTMVSSGQIQFLALQEVI